MKKILVIGGGLSGLVSAILLNRKGYNITVIEKKRYPFHKVCGEYISNEVRSFLTKNGLFPSEFKPSEIHNFFLSAPSGKNVSLPLSLGGFGISRYSYDHFLYTIAKCEGVIFRLGEQVETVVFENNHFHIESRSGYKGSYDLVLSAHGKRSKIDKNLHRSFIEKRSSYIGVKYHIKSDFRNDTVAIHNFDQGYCGLVKIEKDLYNLCYLTTSQNLKKHGNVPQMEEFVLKKNVFLKDVWANADFVFNKPKVINEISFAPKSLILDHILMVGDSASMITPLCGNGMAMAIHAAKLVSESICHHWKNDMSPSIRAAIEDQYKRDWKGHFAARLSFGRVVQKLYGSNFSSNFLVGVGKLFPSFSNKLVQQTHGREVF